VLKEGIYEDHERSEKLLALSRFTTTVGETRSLEQYVADLKPNQTEIYYLVGESLERVRSNPKLEAARARGIEVLLLTDPVDALWTSLSLDFAGKRLKSLSQGEVDLSLVPMVDQAVADKGDPKPAEVDDAAVIAAVKAALGERIADVRASQRLTDSAACLVASGGFDRELTRLLARHNKQAGAKPILELNMRHPIVTAVARAKEAARAEDVADLAALLFEQATLLDGEVPDDPAAFTARVNRWVVRGLAPAG
jgi:molecular chaperone HtpG